MEKKREYYSVRTGKFKPNSEIDLDMDRTSTGQAPDKYRSSLSEADRLVLVMAGEMKRYEIQEALDLKHRDNFRDNYLNPALDQRLIEMTIPEKPTSSNQQYRLTKMGKAIKKKLSRK
jgi:ATP-dependent DNA helicase RecG